MQGPLLRSNAVGAILWLVVSIAGGFVVLSRMGDSGSVAQVLIGALMGLFGSVSHILLSLFPRFRLLNFLWRGFLNWLLAFLVLGLAVVAWYLGNLRGQTENPGFWPGLAGGLLLYVGAPMLCLSLLIALATSTRAGQKGD